MAELEVVDLSAERRPSLEIHYEDGGEWAALYVDGRLDAGTVGDTYHAENRAFDLCGVRRVHDDAFMRGGNTRSQVAQTLEEVEAYRTEREARRARAAELRAEAARLEAEAAGLVAQAGEVARG